MDASKIWITVLLSFSFRLLFSYIVKCEDIECNKKYREIRLILTFTLQDFVRMQITVMSTVLYIHFVRERI